jgi:hypothetical protein
MEDKGLFIKRCRDTARDQRGYVLTLDDGDLGALTAARKAEDGPAFFSIRDDRFSQLVT